MVLTPGLGHHYTRLPMGDADVSVLGAGLTVQGSVSGEEELHPRPFGVAFNRPVTMRERHRPSGSRARWCVVNASRMVKLRPAIQYSHV